MPITDYKVTDIERDAVRMEGKADPLQGTLAQNQAEFDEYPELVRDNLDGLCDYLATMPISYTSSAAASTANKGAITGFVPLGAIIELSMTNGNTAVSPTISIDGVTHSITGMPTTAQVQSNSTQTYRLVKTGATALTFTKNPDYICEYGVKSSLQYALWASGQMGNTVTYMQLIGSTALQSLTQSWATFNKFNTSEGTGVTQGVMATSLTNGTITCNFDGYVEISAESEFTGATAADAIGMRLVVGGAEKFYIYTAVASNGIHNLHIAPIIVPVTSGTVIEVQGMNATAARGSMGRNSNNAVSGNVLTVRRV